MITGPVTRRGFSFTARQERRKARLREDTTKTWLYGSLAFLATATVFAIVVIELGPQALIAPITIAVVMMVLAIIWTRAASKNAHEQERELLLAFKPGLKHLAEIAIELEWKKGAEELHAFDLGLKAFGEVFRQYGKANELGEFIDYVGSLLEKESAEVSEEDRKTLPHALRMLNILGHCVESSRELGKAEHDMRAVHQKLGILPS